MRAHVPHFLSLRPRARLAVAIACCCAAPIAWSQQAATTRDTAKTLANVTVHAVGPQAVLPP
ncbi:hypothetical protein, partial [Xanthomonas hortorum]|uniref:hypothetical protein n=1 Tax=Xanthomonas hortorum TaxID=56454 RepID=UPI003983667F